MRAWVTVDEHGCVLRAGTGPTLPHGAVVVPSLPPDLSAWRWETPAEVWIEDPDHPSGAGGHWHRTGGWVERPALPAPTATAEGFAFCGLPEGAQVEVYDIEADVLLGALTPEADGALAVSLPDPARYLIIVTAPSPWLGGEYTIEREG